MLGEKLLLLAQQFAKNGILNWVVSPGSRNAPIVAALIKEGSFKLYSSPDERSAAFTAMGMAISTQQPAAFLCTSGSALSNAFPAVLESYYSRIPLVIVSADRPEELIDQWEGQTIRQVNFFGDYARSFVHINARMDDKDLVTDKISKSINKSYNPIGGPVHINIALSEPIYEGLKSNSFQPIKNRTESTQPKNDNLSKSFKFPFEIHSNTKVALIIGQGLTNTGILKHLAALSSSIPVFTDVTSGYAEIGLSNWDWALLKRNIPENLKPDLIITMGMGIISKPLKLELRKWKPKHIHISKIAETANPFQTNPLRLICDEVKYLQELNDKLSTELSKDYLDKWKSFIDTQALSPKNLPLPYNLELELVQQLIQSSNEKHHLHFGNSMSVRYASWSKKSETRIFSNRGVSGIDGCVSSALGDALSNPKKMIIAIVGDITTLYDSNAFWGKWPHNFHLVILNNKGGAIFDWIEGPNNLKELRSFIHTPHDKPLKHLAELHTKSFKTFNLKVDQVTLDEIIQSQVSEIITQ